MNWLLLKHIAIENAKLFSKAILTVLAIITGVILTVYLMSLNITVGLVGFLVVNWIVLTVVDYCKEIRDRMGD